MIYKNILKSFHTIYSGQTSENVRLDSNSLLATLANPSFMTNASYTTGTAAVEAAAALSAAVVNNDPKTSIPTSMAHQIQLCDNTRFSCCQLYILLASARKV